MVFLAGAHAGAEVAASCFYCLVLFCSKEIKADYIVLYTHSSCMLCYNMQSQNVLRAQLKFEYHIHTHIYQLHKCWLISSSASPFFWSRSTLDYEIHTNKVGKTKDMRIKLYKTQACVLKLLNLRVCWRKLLFEITIIITVDFMAGKQVLL